MQQSGPAARFLPSETVDFAIVGSGAAGGIIAKELATAGFSVVVLEQGPRLTTAQFDHDEFGTFMRSHNSNSPETQPQTFRRTPKDIASLETSGAFTRAISMKPAGWVACRALGS
jgi:choline dehydrogenase-like flavoprotein